MLLIIDDEASIRDAVSDILALEHLQTLRARDGEEGLRLFAENYTQIQAILLDMQMPRMDGLETLTRIRQLDAKIPIIISSGYTSQDPFSAVQDDDHIYFLHKPFSIEELLGTVGRALHSNAD